MYNVPARFHTLAIADSPKTRCRIYFISDAVNCWDDNAVQTNGTLLVGAAGDTDSNGRIGQGGVTVTEIYNKDKNLTLGGTVSYQIGMTLMNADGALNNFAFGRCKVYLDVYDDANSAWLPCPLGVFRIELPVKRKVQLISCTGYDQMQVLNAIADTWWNGLDFTGGLTIANILNSMVTQLGLHLSSTSSTNMVNTTLSFTTPPIDSVERTYRDILGWIAEATGTVAHFNRDGELDMRQYLTPQIGGNNIVIDTDTTGNQCLSIDVAEYSVSQIDALTIKLTTSDQGVTVGSGTNVYTIMDNPFLYGPDVATIQNKLTPIYNRLSAYATYSPISTRLIYDWSIEAGDIIYITNNSTTYNMPIFQQKMVWRGGYVTAELLSSGDTVRPQVSSSERETYRYNVEMATKVGDNEIISKINQTAEQITIQASKVDLAGYVTFTNLSTAGQTVIDGGNITTGSISANKISGGTLIVGGQNNQNGAIIVKDANGNQSGSISNLGVSITAYNNNRLAMQMGRYQNGGAFLIGYGSNGSPTVEIDSQYGTLSLRDANIIRRVEMSGDTGIFTLKDKNGANLITVHSDPDQADFGPQFDGPVTMNEPVTMNSTLDVTQRRCEATLPASSGSGQWYRVFDYSAANEARVSGDIAFSIDITILEWARQYHKITLYGILGALKFGSEISVTQTSFIDKIRYWKNGTHGYIDVHYTGGVSRYVACYFDVKCNYADNLNRFSSMTPTAVADAPSGSELSTYTFVENTGGKITFTPTSGSVYRGCWYARIGNVCYLHVDMQGLTPSTNTKIFTLPVGFRPEYSTTIPGAGQESYGALASCSIQTDGSVYIYSQDHYAIIDGSFICLT